LETRPLGFVEYREAVGPKGKYGKWLRRLPTVVRIEDSIFLHGGIHPTLSKYKLKELNTRLAKERDTFDEWVSYLVSRGIFERFFTLDEMFTVLRSRLQAWSGDPLGTDGDTWMDRLSFQDQQIATISKGFLKIGNWYSVHPDGPLWFRGYGKWTEEEGTPQVAEILEKYGAGHFVVGHTIRAESEVLRRFGGRVILIDTLRPTALEIIDGNFVAVYPDRRELLSIDSETSASNRRVSNPLE
jgi:hypothetical protein